MKSAFYHFNVFINRCSTHIANACKFGYVKQIVLVSRVVTVKYCRNVIFLQLRSSYFYPFCICHRLKKYVPQVTLWHITYIRFKLRNLSFIANYLLASSIATATATVIPTMGLLPAPMRPIISTR